jgi:hypothetical protein
MTAEGQISAITVTFAPRRRRWPWFALPVVLSLGILGGIYFYKTHSADSRLQRARAEADRLDPGWTFAELEARRPEVPDEENASLHVLAAKTYLPFPKSALALQKLRELPPPEQLHPHDIRDIGVELARVKPALDQVRQNRRLSTGRYPLAHAPDMIMTLLPHVDSLSAIRFWLWLEVCRRAQEQDCEGAFESARVLFNSARGIGDELFMVSQNVRQASISEALRMLERILAQGEVSDQSLAGFQQLIQEEDAFPSLLISMRGERAVLDLALQRLESREVPVTSWRQMDLLGKKSDFITGISQVDDTVYWYSIGSIKEIRASLLEFFTQLVEAAKLPVEKLETRREELNDLFEKLPPKVQGMFGSFKMNAIVIFQRTRAELRSADVMLALERYRMAQGRWPESLAELVPAYLPKVPLDPYDAAPLRYRKLDDGCVVYSIGTDKRDQGGDIARTSVGIKTPGNFGFRLWNVNARRQPASHGQE